MNQTSNQAFFFKHFKAWIGSATLLFFVLVFLVWSPFRNVPEYPNRELLPFIWGAFLVLLGVVWVLKWGRQKESPFVLLNLFALGYGGSLALLWAGLEFVPYGTTNDGWFLHAMASKAAFGWENVDFSYKGLNTFYPPLYPWVAGKLAALLGVPAWTGLKVTWLLVNFALPYALFFLWRKLTSEWVAMLLMVGGMYLSREALPGKTYEAITLNLMVPWLLHFVLGRGIEQDSFWRRVIIGGLIGGLLFLNYYYYLLILILVLPVYIASVVVQKRKWAQIKPVLLAPFGVLVVAGVISLPFVLPLLSDLFILGSEPLQNRWFLPRMIRFSMKEPGVFWLIPGLLLLVVAAVKNALARDLLLLGLCQFLWIGLGMVLVMVDFPLLHAHWFGFELYLAWFGLVWGMEQGLDKWASGDYTPLKVWLPAALALLFFSFTIQYNGSLKREYAYEAAQSSFVPDPGMDPEFLEEVRNKVFLTNRVEMAAFFPIYLFIGHNSHYAHPSSEFRERLKFISLVSKSDNPAFVAWILQNNRFGKVDYFLMDKLKMVIGEDNFPSERPHLAVETQFNDIRKWPWFQHQAALPGLYKLEEGKPEDMNSFSQAESCLAWHYGNERVRSHLRGIEPRGEAIANRIEGRVRNFTAWSDSIWTEFSQ